MRKWIDQTTFDELLLANAEDNIERAIQGASAVLETVQEFVPDAALFYRVTHAADSLKNYFEEVSSGFRRNGILFLVRRYFYPKAYYDRSWIDENGVPGYRSPARKEKPPAPYSEQPRYSKRNKRK